MLIKEIEQRNGATAEYWEVSSITIDIAQSKARIMVLGYVSKEIKEQGKPYIAVKTLTVNAADYMQFFGPSIATQAETYIKHLPEFTGAIDG